jgi:hypothetical protein
LAALAFGIAPSKVNCSQITPPPAPADNPNASVLNNMATILGAQAGASITPGGGAAVFAGWVASVLPGSVWDYKKNLSGPARQAAANFGNFNYGATCAQFGLSSSACQLAAGAAGGFVGPASTKYDIPIDNYYVQQGYQYATCKSGS